MAILTMLVLAQANNFTPPTLYETEVHPQLQGVDPRNTPDMINNAKMAVDYLIKFKEVSMQA
jgi:hypothetical protein